ncbi:putative membrane protein, partial [Bacteroides fragilis str. 3986 N(B)19]
MQFSYLISIILQCFLLQILIIEYLPLIHLYVNI